MFQSILLAITLITLTSTSFGQTIDRPLRISVLDFGNSEFARLCADKLRASLKADKRLTISDSQLAAAAARGIHYSGSLNLSVVEARDLGAALDADYYLLGDAQTLRRSPSQGPVYFESYCSLFLISSRTGQLLLWDRPAVQNANLNVSEHSLVEQLAGVENRQRILNTIVLASAEETAKRAIVVDVNEPLLEAPDDEKTAEAQGLRLPRPFSRLRPAYPDSAAQAEAEATVDVIVDVESDGEVGQVQIARWGGFGLDEATVATVKQMHFFPAQRNGTPVAMRVLLRYNFRKPQN